MNRFMSDCGCQFEAKNKAQRKILRVLFALNAAMFMTGIIAGTLAQSTALIADSLDGLLVNLLNSPYPDLIIGLMIAIIVIRGGIGIIRDARNEQTKYQRV